MSFRGCLSSRLPAYVSVFAGRRVDAGIDYRPIMRDAIARARRTTNVEIIWASTREVFNVIEANEVQCHIITAPAAVLKKLPSLGTRTAAELSLDAVKAFREDAVSAADRGCARRRVTLRVDPLGRCDATVKNCAFLPWGALASHRGRAGFATYCRGYWW